MKMLLKPCALLVALTCSLALASSQAPQLTQDKEVASSPPIDQVFVASQAPAVVTDSLVLVATPQDQTDVIADTSQLIGLTETDNPVAGTHYLVTLEGFVLQPSTFKQEVTTQKLVGNVVQSQVLIPGFKVIGVDFASQAFAQPRAIPVPQGHFALDGGGVSS